MLNSTAEKNLYVLKSPPLRPTFQQDMTEDERAIMYKHIDYWSALADQGIAIVFGPVAEPDGGYGLALVQVENEEQIRAIIADDPAVIAGLLKTAFSPMFAVLPKKLADVLDAK